MDVLLFAILLAISFCLGLVVALAGLAYYILYFRKIYENPKPDHPSPSKLRETGQFVHFTSPLDSTRRTINVFPMDCSSFLSSSSATPLGRRLGHQSLERGLQNALALQQKQRINLESMMSTGVDLSSIVGTGNGLYPLHRLDGRGYGVDPILAARKTSTARKEFTVVPKVSSLPKCSIIEINQWTLYKRLKNLDTSAKWHG